MPNLLYYKTLDFSRANLKKVLKSIKRTVVAEIQTVRGRDALVVSSLGDMSLKDTLECGQAFRYEELFKEGDYIEYLTVAMGRLMVIGQSRPGELIFY